MAQKTNILKLYWNRLGMGIFNFIIVIPQITAAAILCFFVKNLFSDEAIYALLLGGVSFLFAALLVLKVDDVDEVKSSR